jgi:hypothetical protein
MPLVEAAGGALLPKESIDFEPGSPSVLVAPAAPAPLMRVVLFAPK